MNLIGTLAIAMGAGWVSGVNLYAAVATLGLLGRFANLRLPGELDVLASWWIIGIASALYLIEFFADKIPYLDSTWDAIHTFIRIPAGAVLAATAFGDFDRSVQVVAFAAWRRPGPERPWNKSDRPRGDQPEPRAGIQRCGQPRRGCCRL